MNAEDPDGFAAAAAELYAMPAAAFVAERNAQAKAARADGHRDLAARIGALPKPSASAWLVNLLVREGADDLDRVLELGAALRAAQRAADRSRLRELGGRRRELLSEVTARAADLADRAGQAASAAALEEFTQTVQAVLADDGAADAVRTGRLVRALQADGLGSVDATDAVGGAGGHRSAPPGGTVPATARGRADDQDGDAERAREERERRAAEHARRVEEAERRADGARGAARDAAARVAALQQDVETRRSRVSELRALLRPAETAEAEAEAALTDARSQARAAARARTEAEQEAARAR